MHKGSHTAMSVTGNITNCEFTMTYKYRWLNLEAGFSPQRIINKNSILIQIKEEDWKENCLLIKLK